MSKSAHTEAQIIGAVKQVEAGRKADEVARELNSSTKLVSLKWAIIEIRTPYTTLPAYATT